jgi:hypothetical protein
MRRLLVFLLLAALLLIAAPVSARSEAMCGFRCNVEGFDFCIATWERNYACWEMTGGCISGGYNCGGPGW